MPDKFANMLSMAVNESAATTITFRKVESGISLFDKVGWIVHRMEYYFPTPTAAGFPDDGDRVTCGLVVRNDLTHIDDITNLSVVDWAQFRKFEEGTPAVSSWLHWPTVHDFTGLPSGGILVAPNPLYMAIEGENIGGAQYCFVRIFYSVMDMKGDDYYELLQTRLGNL
jgi:hypothetical protein